MSEWSVYLVRCGDGSLYTGITTDVERRLREHSDAGRSGAKSLRGRGPLSIVFDAIVGERHLALKAESRIKGLSKREKERLIRDNPGTPALLDRLQLADTAP